MRSGHWPERRKRWCARFSLQARSSRAVSRRARPSRKSPAPSTTCAQAFRCLGPIRPCAAIHVTSAGSSRGRRRDVPHATRWAAGSPRSSCRRTTYRSPSHASPVTTRPRLRAPASPTSASRPEPARRATTETRRQETPPVTWSQRRPATRAIAPLRIDLHSSITRASYRGRAPVATMVQAQGARPRTTW